ncbi:DUF3592 domain-containing protein [Altererythrobacter sp. MTPC7]|uniref:DUF3592 domain-containing protein n=1 Tax=Altererythrobacter sp. MTPC7 TaxID=3056567 RepID=UPI0036F1EE2D
MIFLLLSVPLSAIVIAGMKERDRRADILARGESAEATVTRSSGGVGKCLFDYEFVIDGQSYEGGPGGCPLAGEASKGTRILIRYLPGDPDENVAVGAAVWPGWIAVPILLGGALLVIFPYLFVMEWWERRKLAKRRQRPRPSSPTSEK